MKITQKEVWELIIDKNNYMIRYNVKPSYHNHVYSTIEKDNNVIIPFSWQIKLRKRYQKNYKKLTNKRLGSW